MLLEGVHFFNSPTSKVLVSHHDEAVPLVACDPGEASRNSQDTEECEGERLGAAAGGGSGWEKEGEEGPPWPFAVEAMIGASSGDALSLPSVPSSLSLSL